MAIKKNTEGLKKKVVKALKDAKVSVPDINEKTGKISGMKDIPFISETDEGKIVEIKDASKPKYGEKYSSNKETGIEKIAEAIVNETLSYIVEEAEVNLKARLDKLESDYNIMIAAMVTAAGTLTAQPLTLVGTAFNTVANAGGGPTRAVDTTEKLKAENEETDIG